MEVHLQSGHRLPDNGSEVDAPAMIGGFCLPAIPQAVIDDNALMLDRTKSENHWRDEERFSSCAVLEAALDKRLIQPQEITAVPTSHNAEHARTRLVETASERASRLMRARLERWVHSYGYDLCDDNVYYVFTQDMDAADNDKQPLLAVASNHDNYYNFQNVPERVQGVVFHMIELLSLIAAPRMNTADAMEMSMIGEDLEIMNEMFREHDGDTSKLWEAFWAETRAGNMPFEMLGDYFGLEPDQTKKQAAEAFTDCLDWLGHYRRHQNRVRAAMYAQGKPRHTDRMMMRHINAIRADATPAEQVWLDWVTFARRGLRFAQRHRINENRADLDGEIIDAVPLEYTSLLDFNTPWCQMIVHDMSDMVMNSGEEALMMYRAENADAVARAYQDFSVQLVADAPVQAAIMLDIAIQEGEQGSSQLNLSFEAA